MTTIASLHRWTLLGTGALGTMGVMGGSSTLIGLGLANLAALAFAGRDLHDEARSPTRRWLVHGTTVILLVVAVILFRRLQVDSVFIVLMLGVTNRALLRASSRDDLLVVGGSTVLLTAATVVTSGLGFALLLVSAVPCAAAALWTSTMLAGAEHSPSDLARLRTRRAPGGLGFIAVSSLLLTVVGFGVSTLLPRYRFTPFLAAGALARLSGASDTMQLTNDGAPDREDGAAVMHVVPIDGADRGSLEGLYARVHALDEFDGKTWRARTGGHFTPQDGMEAALAGKPKARISKPREVRSGVHFSVPVLGRRVPWAVSGPSLHYDASGSMVVDGIAGRTLDYVAGIDVPLAPPRVPPTFRAATSSVVRFVPPDLDPRIVALGRELTAGARDDDERIQRVLSHFSRGFVYSTDPAEGTAEDPLVRFLFESRTGHCELYAGAAAVLLRVAGVDARVASGYYLGHWNDVAEFLTFSQGDAHAWVEVRAAGGDWRWVDATPEDLRRGERAQSVLRRFQDWYDAASALWYSNVVDFDAKRQQSFYLNASRALDERLRQWRSDRSGGGSGGGWTSILGGAGRAVPAPAIAGLVALGLVAAALWARQRRTTAALGQRLRAALGATRTEAGLPLGVLADRAKVAEAGAAVQLYERLRFAPRGEQPPRAEVIRAIASLERARKRTA